MNINYLAVVVATIAAFLFSFAYYAPLGTRMAQLKSVYAEEQAPQLGTVVLELARNAVIALVIVWLSARLEVTGVTDALGLALALWVAFPVMLLAGSVIHEKEPRMLATIHAGDWLGKLLLITLIVGMWR